MPTRHLFFAIALIMGFFTTGAQAEKSEDFGGYVVHYNAFTTDTLPIEVAKTYGITRSRNRAMLNVTVLKKLEDGTTEAVNAQVTAGAANLTGQYRELKMRQINDGKAIYYIGDVAVANEETLDFEIVSVVGSEKPIRRFDVRFRQKFYTR